MGRRAPWVLPVRYPISTSKHSNRQRGSEADRWQHPHPPPRNPPEPPTNAYKPSHSPLMPTNPATHRRRSTHTTTTTTTPQPTTGKKKKKNKTKQKQNKTKHNNNNQVRARWVGGVDQRRGLQREPVAWVDNMWVGWQR